MSGVIAAIGVGVAAAGALAAHVQQNQQAANQRGDAAKAVAAAGTAQKATAADTSGVSGTNAPAAAGVNSGPASTLLTGSGGVASSALNLGGGSALGSNTLLGS